MRTITLHVSAETAAALEVDRGRLERAEKMLVGQMMVLEAQHPDSCVDPQCATIQAIETTKGSIELLHRVLKFEHDVLGAYRYAPAEVE